MLDHIFVVYSFQMWAVVARQNRAVKVMARGRLGT
jgi:hypothetical protein